MVHHDYTQGGSGCSEQDRDRAEVRVPAAAIHVAEGCPEEAIEPLAPVTERSVDFRDADVGGHDLLSQFGFAAVLPFATVEGWVCRFRPRRW